MQNLLKGLCVVALGATALRFAPEATGPVTERELFDVELPSRIARDPEVATALAGKLQVVIPGAGTWLIDGSSTTPRVERGAHPEADATVTMTREDFQAYRADPRQLVRMKIQGDPRVATRMHRLLER